MQVLQLAEVEGLEPRLAHSFVKEVIYPFAIKEYQIEHSASCPNVESGKPLIVDLVVKCINTYKIPREQVSFHNCIYMQHTITGSVTK